jgi:hypothetical protein
VYRELHGVLGEGKDHFASGLAVTLYLLNTTARSTIIDRLKVRVAISPPFPLLGLCWACVGACVR